jgi:tetratricopeptide (TPR) repeat protein
MLLSKSCEVAKADADKALSIGGGPDVYTALGAMYSGCGDLTSSVKFSSMALELTPNDNGWLITNNLVSALYRLERYDEIRDVVEENIEAEDMLPSILGVYAILEFMDGNKKNAKLLLKKAKSRGLDQKRIRSSFKKPTDAEKLITELAKIGPFD